jgi:flagellin-like hook-associated protein FlgL
LGVDQLKGLGIQAKSLQDELEQILKRKDSSGYRIFNVRELNVIVDGGTAGTIPVSVNSIGNLRGLELLLTDDASKIPWEDGVDAGGAPGISTDPDIDRAVNALVFGEDWLDTKEEKEQSSKVSFLQEFVANLRNGKRLAPGRSELREASYKLIEQQMSVGAAQARVDRSVQRTEDLNLAVLTALSNEVDTDFAESTMEVQKAKALLEAAQSITATIGSMSLFQRLG